MNRSPIGICNSARRAALLLLAAMLGAPVAMAQQSASQPVLGKPATPATQAANLQVQQSLPFQNKVDFENAQKGFIATPKTLTIKDANGRMIWDLEAYKTYIGLDKPAPDTVNPSLWRNAQLGMLNGLFEVTDGIYQVRGYDLSNITFIKTNSGWIVFDPLISPEIETVRFMPPAATSNSKVSVFPFTAAFLIGAVTFPPPDGSS